VGHSSTNHNSPRGRVVHKVVSTEFPLLLKCSLSLLKKFIYIYIYFFFLFLSQFGWWFGGVTTYEVLCGNGALIWLSLSTLATLSPLILWFGLIFCECGDWFVGWFLINFWVALVAWIDFWWGNNI